LFNYEVDSKPFITGIITTLNDLADSDFLYKAKLMASLRIFLYFEGGIIE